MTNININIDLSKMGDWMNILVSRVNQLTIQQIPIIALALILPPLAVFVKVGLTAHFWINVVLTLLGYVPGQLHALWVVLFL